MKNIRGKGSASQVALWAASRALRRASDSLARTGAARALKQRQVFADARALFQFTRTFEFAGLTIAPLQLEGEYVRFLELVAALQPKTVIEIGTARGGTLFILTRVAPSDATFVAIDYAPPGYQDFGGSPQNHRNARLFRSFARADQRVEFLFSDSHEASTLARVKSLLAAREVDLLFIDGDHTLEGVRTDYTMYAPLVRAGGLIAFHDIAPGLPEAVGGVPEFWREIKDDDAIELVSHRDQGGYGIGVLRKPKPL